MGDVISFPPHDDDEHGHDVAVREDNWLPANRDDADVEPAAGPKPSVRSVRTVAAEGGAYLVPPTGAVTRWNGKPLSPRDRGYVRSVATHGVAKAPLHVWDRAWDWLKLAPLREGGTHRGQVIERHQQAYVTHQRARTQRVARVAKTVTKPWYTTRKVDKVPVAAVTWGGTVLEGADLAWPHAPVLAHTIGLLNSAIGDVLAAAGTALAPAIWPVIGVAGAATAVYGIAAEHKHRVRVLASRRASGHYVAPEQIDDYADMLTQAFRDAGIIRSDAKVLLTNPVVQAPGGGWRADLQLPSGCTVGMVRKLDRLDRLASALATTPAYLSVLDGDTSASFSLTKYKKLPFTGPAVAHPLISGGRVDVATDKVPGGLDINGNAVLVDIVRGKHGLIVASSGNGKTQHLVGLMLTLAFDPDTSMVLLDGKPDGTLDPLVPLVDAHVDASMSNWLDKAAQLLEAEVEHTRERQQRIRRGEKLGFRLVILDEFQMFTGNTSAGGIKQGSPQRRIRTALAELSRLGRSAMEGLVLATQSYDGNIVDVEVLNNIGWRLVGYAPSKMSREALGEHADRYELDTSKMLVDTEQAGTAVVVSPGIERYALARGWYQKKKAVAGAVKLALQVREQAGTLPDRSRLNFSAGSDLGGSKNRVAEDRKALLGACAEVYANDDSELITNDQLVKEIAVGELGWPSGKATEMRIAEALDGHVEKRRKPIGPPGPDGNPTKVVVRSRVDLLSAARRIDQTA